MGGWIQKKRFAVPLILATLVFDHRTFSVDCLQKQPQEHRVASRIVPNQLIPHVAHEPPKRGWLKPAMTRYSFIASATASLLSIPAVALAEVSESQNAATMAAPSGLSANSAIATTVDQTKMLLSSDSTSFQEAVSGFVSGAALAGTKTLIKYPLDTATVRIQMPNSYYSIQNPGRLFSGCYNGVTLTLLSNIPAGAVFFAVKDAAKSGIKNSFGASLPRWVTTSLAVAVAQIPYWLVRNPSEVVKVRQQAGIEGYGEGISAIDAVKTTLARADQSSNDVDISEFYTGFWENCFYALPADVIKFVAYDAITKGRKDLSALEGATAGAFATAASQLFTTPLDVVRNRLMTGKDQDGDEQIKEGKTRGYVESLVLLGKDEGLKGLFAGATPRIGKALLSGAVQFATYEVGDGVTQLAPNNLVFFFYLTIYCPFPFHVGCCQIQTNNNKQETKQFISKLQLKSGEQMIK